MKYEYGITYPPDADGRFRKRPLVEVEIIGPKGKLKELALLDSGADRSLFHREIADYLGIDLTNAERRRTIGITGDTEALYTDVDIVLAGTSKKIRMPVGFTDIPYVSALLGQEGFFDAHRITFERYQSVFTISPIRHKHA